MQYAAWHALNTLTDSARADRTLREASAAKGNAIARQSLEEPLLPESIAYLWHRVLEIRTGLGDGLNGLERMTWLALDAWSRLTGVLLDPFESRALIAVDAALRHPDSWQRKASTDEDERVAPVASWPEMGKRRKLTPEEFQARYGHAMPIDVEAPDGR